MLSNKKTKLNTAIWLTVVALAVLSLPVAATAQDVNDFNVPDFNLPEDPNLPLEPQMPGTIEGTGTYFEVTNSNYIDITFDSNEPVHLRLESVPEMVVMDIEAAEGATSTEITLGGFEPNTTYYKYEDDYHNLTPFTTDPNGSVTYTQDLNEPHLAFIQPRESTIFLSSSGWSNPAVGTWDAGTQTGTLTTDVYETIQIDGSGITLEGNGHTVSGSGTGYGVYHHLYRAGVTIKNLNVQGFSYGMYLTGSGNNTLIGNTATSNEYGIYVIRGEGTLTGNTASNNEYGIYLRYPGGYTLRSNTMAGNSRNFHVYVESSASQFDNDIDTSNTVEGKPILYHFAPTNLVVENTDAYGTIYVTNGDNVRLSNVVLAANNWAGIHVWNTRNLTIEGVTSGNSHQGVYLRHISGCALTGNTTNSNYEGMHVRDSSELTVTGNTAKFNGTGIWLQNCTNVTVTANSIEGNRRPGMGYGILVRPATSCTLTGNTVNSNDFGLVVSWGDDVTVTDNTANLNYGHGITAKYCTNGTVARNTTEGNGYYGIALQGSSGCAVTQNTSNANSRLGIYLTYTSACIVTENTTNSNSTGILLMTKAVGNTVADNIINGNVSDGIQLTDGCNDNILTGNNISSSNRTGITLYAYCNNNTVSNNTVSDSTDRGIWLTYCTDNRIYNNNFINNTTQALDFAGSGNLFNLDRPIGGNYWSDWTTPDDDGDGFVDFPYIFAYGQYVNQDNLPWAIPNGWLNQPPVAVCRDVTVMADSYCEGVVAPEDVDNGSSDPDGDPITLSLSPEGPYPIGTTAVTLTVTDDQGASSTCTATVTVLGADEGILQLIAEVMALNLQNGIENSLDAKLDAALKALDDVSANNDVAAINAIEAFINAVQAQSGNKIPNEADADDLIDIANEIIVGLQNGCY
jgi:parallel beta-helix repeat protein